MNDIADKITETLSGYHIKNLKWNAVDSIYVGLVKDELYGRKELRDGYICVQWNRHGKPLKLNKGREELILKMPIL